MTKIVIRYLDLNKYNLEHAQKHNVAQEEIIEVGKSFLYHRKAHSGRYLAIGRVGTRIITLVIRRKSVGQYYLVTARDASKKERRDLYAKEK